MITESVNRRLTGAIVSIAAAGLFVLAGCSSVGLKKGASATAAQDEPSAAAAKPGAQQSPGVESISVVGDGGRVMILTNTSVRYTVFKLSEPSRLVVDIPGASLDKIAKPIKVDNDYVGEISAVTYGGEEKIGRIIIGLRNGIEHDVSTGENSILVSLRKPSADTASSAATPNGAAPTEQAAPTQAVEAAAQAVVAAQAETPTEAAPERAEAAVPAPAERQEAEAKPASKILKIEVEKDPGATSVKVVADGMIGNYNSFELDSPARVIVDLWNVGNSTGQDTIKVKDAFVKGVRIGGHPDKVRLVFDASGKKAPNYQVTKVDNAIVVAIGPSVQKVSAKVDVQPVPAVRAAKAEPPAPQAAAEPAPATAPVQTASVEPPREAAKDEGHAPPAKAEAQAAPVDDKQQQAAEEPSVNVQRIDFKKTAGVGKLMITVSSVPEYAVRETEDGKTLVIDLKGAVLPDTLVRTLDATKLKTSVVSVSSYQESKKPDSVRILVKLSDKSPYDVKENGNAITVSFAELKGAAAQATAAAKAPQAPEAPVKTFGGKRIDLDMMDANVSDVLRLLAEVSGMNIVVSDDVKGAISLRLKNVPWDQAFDIILKTKDLDKIQEGNVIRVAPSAKVRQERDAALVAVKAVEKLENLDVKFMPVNYAKAADLEKQVKDVLSERGSVSSEARTNTLIIKDIKRGIDAATSLVAKLDTPIPQVLIEARIVEAENTFVRELGIQWGVDWSHGGQHTRSMLFGSSGTAGQSPPNSGGTLAGFPPLNQQHGAQNFAVNLPASTSRIGTMGGLGFVLGRVGQNAALLDLRLTASEQDGRIKTISRPRITTLDNKEAKIEQGESLPFETTSASGTSTVFIDANLSLTVTPHITPDGSVVMKIKASNNAPGEITSASGARSIKKKESTTEVLVKDGETTVIGGIVISDSRQTDSGIPYLMNIPVIGWLFRNKSVFDQQKELLIFITPTIIKETPKTVG